MKAMFCAGSLVVALAAVIGAGRLFADGKENKPAKRAKPQTRIALLNLTYVIKNYEKYKNFQEEIKEAIEPFKKRDQKLRAQLDKLRTQAEKIQKEKDSPIVPAKAEDPEGGGKKTKQDQKEHLEERAKKIQREIEDNSAKTKMVLGKKSDDEMKLLFQDVYEAARRYAAAHDIDLVLHYNDATTAEDYMSPQNVARKLNTGALSPLYVAEGMDISKELADLLNKGMRKN